MRGKGKARGAFTLGEGPIARCLFFGLYQTRSRYRGWRSRPSSAACSRLAAADGAVIAGVAADRGSGFGDKA